MEFSMSTRIKIAVENVNVPGQITNVDATKYETIKAALLVVQNSAIRFGSEIYLGPDANKVVTMVSGNLAIACTRDFRLG